MNAFFGNFNFVLFSGLGRIFLSSTFKQNQIRTKAIPCWGVVRLALREVAWIILHLAVDCLKSRPRAMKECIDKESVKITLDSEKIIARQRREKSIFNRRQTEGFRLSFKRFSSLSRFSLEKKRTTEVGRRFYGLITRAQSRKINFFSARLALTGKETNKSK